MHLKKSEYHGKVNFSRNLIQDVTPSYIIESLHIKWHVSSLLCCNIDDHGLQLMEIKNPVSQNIRIKNFKIQKCEPEKSSNLSGSLLFDVLRDAAILNVFCTHG